MKYKIFKNNIFLSVIFGIIIFLVAIFINLDSLNKNFQKHLFNYSYKINDEIIVVKIDEKTTSQLGRFPFDRKVYAKLIENLDKAGVSVIGFDIIFADKTNDDSDNQFAKSIQKSGKIVLGGGTKNNVSINGVFEKPLNILTKENILVGYFDIKSDSYIGTVFSASLTKKFKNGEFEYFGLSILRKYFANQKNDKSYLTQKVKIDENYLRLKDIKIPFSHKNSNDVLINYEKQKFNSYSFYNIYNNKNFEQIKNNLKNKIVIIGATLRGVDIKKTTENEEEFGVNVHASFLNTVLNNNFSKYLNTKIELLLLIIFTIIVIYTNFKKGTKYLILSNLLFFSIIIIYFGIIKFNKLVLNYPSELFLSFILAAIISNIGKYVFENKDKIKLHKALSEYVSKDVVKEILSGEGLVNLDGEKKRIAIFFSDIEGFTSISEKLPPSELINFLKDYLSEMSDIIIEKNGFINKYEGDAILALWGVFKENEVNISKIACESALKQMEVLKELNKKWKKYNLSGEINIRIGLNIGDAIIGNIGSKGKKIEFTAIGDSVNLASRLEAINKFYGTRLCVSENIYNETKNHFDFRYLDKIRVKGKENAVDIYELIDYKGKTEEQKIKMIKNFQEGVSLYQNKNFKNAYKVFEELEKNGDKASINYKERCSHYMQTPPPKDWDKVWTMTKK